MNDAIRRSVLIQVTLEDSEISGSGFIIGESHVITSTSWMKSVLSMSQGSGQRLKYTEESVTKNAKTTIYWASTEDSVLHQTSATLVSVKYMEKVHQILQHLEKNSLNDWTFTNNSDADDGDDDDQLLHLSCAAIFLMANPVPNLSFSSYGESAQCSVGDEIFVVSTPFGSLYPKIFLNSVCRGCVSNKYGFEGRGEVFLTDARCVRGCEGGMVLVRNSQGIYSVVGMVISPLVDGRDIPVNATLICSLASFSEVAGLHSFSSSDSPHSKQVAAPNTVADHSTLLNTFSSSVLPVSFGSSIGSGVFISDNLVLTCAHVVQRLPSGIVRCKGKDIPATVIYCAPSGSTVDIAILSVRKSNIECPSLDLFYKHHYHKCSVSEPVVSMGYAYQHPFTTDALPTLCRGVVSKLVPNHTHPVMIQTTSCVYQGMSGGLLCSVSDTPSPLGLLICVGRDDAISYNHSRLSFVMPFSWIIPAIQEFATTRNPGVFNVLMKDAWTFTQDCKL